jgi:hypothetical protein
LNSFSKGEGKENTATFHWNPSGGGDSESQIDILFIQPGKIVMRWFEGEKKENEMGID